MGSPIAIPLEQDLEQDIPASTQARLRVSDVADDRPRAGQWVVALRLVVALIGGGGAGAGASALLSGESDATAALRVAVADNGREVAANSLHIAAGVLAQTKADKIQAETELRIMADNATTQLWMAGILIELTEALDRVAAKVGVDAHVRVPPLVRGAK